MTFEDNDNFRPEQRPYSGGQNGGGNHDNDFGAWLLIGIMFLVAWPVGLILLIKKLSDNPQRTKKVVSDTAEHLRSKAQEMRQEQQKQQTRKTQTGKQSAVKKVTQTPQLSDKGAKVMKTIGIILAALGGVAMLGAVGNWLGYAIEYNEWWYFLRQLFYPTGLLAGGLALLIGGGVMKKRMRRFSKYLACAGTRDVIPLSHLMKAANVRESKAERDLELMIEKGMWGPTAYLDRGNDPVNLAMPVWHWGKFYEQMIHKIINGAWKEDETREAKGLNYWWGMSAEVIDVICSKYLPIGTARLVELLKETIRSDTFNPFSGVLYSQKGIVQKDEKKVLEPEEIITMNWLAENVIGQLPDIQQLTDKAKPLVTVQGINGGNQ